MGDRAEIPERPAVHTGPREMPGSALEGCKQVSLAVVALSPKAQKAGFSVQVQMLKTDMETVFMAQNLPRRSLWSSAMAACMLPCQDSTPPTHTGPDPRLQPWALR